MRDPVQDEIENSQEAFEKALEVQVKPNLIALVEKYAVYNTVIEEMKTKYLPLKIAGINDKPGYAVVHDARMHIKNTRIQVEKARKANNEDAREWIKVNDGEAKRIMGLMEPIEDALWAEEKAVDDESDRIKNEAQRVQNERNQSRVNRLLFVGADVALADVVLMSDAVFEQFLAAKTDIYNERQRVAAEAAAAEAARVEREASEKAVRERQEAERQEKVRQEQEAERKRLEGIAEAQAKAAASLKAQQDAIDAQKRQIEQTAREEQARKEGEAKAKVEAEQKAKEAEAKRIKDEEAKAEAERQMTVHMAEIKAARPDAEKLIGFALFLEGKAPPEMATEAGKVVFDEIKIAHVRYCKFIRSKAKGLTE